MITKVTEGVFRGPHQLTNEHVARFWSKVNTNGAAILESLCWEWTASKTKKGYGRIRNSVFGEVTAHRLSYLIHSGAIPSGLWVLHRCDNRACVNPDHLFLGTHKDNMHDCSAKGRLWIQKQGNRAQHALTMKAVGEQRKKSKCIRGHDMSGSNLVTRGNGGRQCRACAVVRTRDWKFRKRMAAMRPMFAEVQP